MRTGIIITMSWSTTELGDDPREPQRVEPDVWIHVVAAGVDRWAAPIRDRVLDGGLESAGEIHDDVGIADLLHVARRELDVVRLDTGRSQVRHRDVFAADLLDREGERIEGRHDLDRVVRAVRQVERVSAVFRGIAAAAHGERHEREGRQDREDDSH